MSSSYQLVFDARTFQVGGFKTGLAIGGGIVLAYHAVKAFRHHRADSWGYGPPPMAIAATFVCLLTFAPIGIDLFLHRDLQASIRNGELREVAGIVQGYEIKEEKRGSEDHPGIKTSEHFRIGHRHFSFDHAVWSSHFTSAANQAIALHDGLRLRVGYLIRADTNLMVRLEIAQ